MKAQDLQIDDLVHIPAYNTDARVRSIGTPFDDGHRQLTLVDDKGLIYSSISEENIQPIPLSEKNILAQGFYFRDSRDHFNYGHDSLLPCIYLTKRKHNGKYFLTIDLHTVFLSILPITYLHQLQHLLRLYQDADMTW